MTEHKYEKAIGQKTNAGAHIQWANQLTRGRCSGPSMPQHLRMENQVGASTLAVHAGTYEDPVTGAIGTPIFQTSTFALSQQTYESFDEGTMRDVPIYSRYGNPTQWAVQEKMSALEGAESSLVFSSGMAAIASTIIALTNKGGHIVTSYDLYGGTYNFMREDLQQMGREVTFVSPTDFEAIESAIQENTQLLFFETLTNPLLKTIPLKQLGELAQRQKLLLVVDNTFLTPICLKPLEYGAHLVIHSCTKYINGHSNLIAGVACGPRKYIDPIWGEMLKLGGCLDPHACYLLENGMKTLEIRLRRQIENARALASFLNTHPQIDAVYHPSLPNYPYPWAYEMFEHGSGGMVSFNVVGGDRAALRLLSLIKIPKVATSLGGVESLVSLPFNTSHSSLTARQQLSIGIKPGLVRYSTGIEDTVDLVTDLKIALEKL